jgi:hypothetical protein
VTRLEDVTYVLPILRREAVARDDELFEYLASIAQFVARTIVVDGSQERVFATIDAALPPAIEHIRPDPSETGCNGKAAGVRTAMRRIETAKTVIADDDVRYDAAGLTDVARALDDADVVRPQNYFSPKPWHAVLDEGRSLLARVTGGDWPGTLGLRTAAYRRSGGYDGDALFENLELVRTLCAAGGRERRLDGTFVARRPPTTRHYVSQRVRQAYDEFARPARLCAQLALGPLFALALLRSPKALFAAAVAGIALAEAGRRKDGATRVFPPVASLLAPVWIAERAVTSWLALWQRACGGASYGGRRLRLAANSTRALRERLAEAAR